MRWTLDEYKVAPSCTVLHGLNTHVTNAPGVTGRECLAYSQAAYPRTIPRRWHLRAKPTPRGYHSETTTAPDLGPQDVPGSKRTSFLRP